MAQLVVRLDDDLVSQVDELVATGTVVSRSDAVRRALAALVDHHRRRRIGQAIVDGYAANPPSDAEFAFTDETAARMIAEERW